MTRKKKQKEEVADVVEPILFTRSHANAASLIEWDDPTIIWGEPAMWDEDEGQYVVYHNPALDALRKIAAGVTPEGQRLNRDQMMALAAGVVGDA